MTDEGGNVVWSAAYTAFGEAIVDSASTVISNLRLPGQYLDEETGLQYNWQRYYEPATGRYVSVDPIGFGAGDENLYRYSKGNSVNDFDPLGLMSCMSACRADAVLNFALGFVPGAKAVIAIASFGGVFDINIFQNSNGYGELYDTGITDIGNAIGSGANWYVQNNYLDAGGESAYNRYKDLAGRKSFSGKTPKAQRKILNNFKKLSKLKGIARIVPGVSHVLNVIDFASDLMECNGKCKQCK